jgi:hypothetical protein
MVIFDVSNANGINGLRLARTRRVQIELPEPRNVVVYAIDCLQSMTYILLGISADTGSRIAGSTRAKTSNAISAATESAINVAAQSMPGIAV